MCDTNWSLVQHQQMVVVSAIVHTDETDQIVSIPPFVPLFYKLARGNPMQTNGVVHVYTGRDLDQNQAKERFFGISIDAFTAQLSRGDDHNRISVAISGMLNLAVPQQKIQNATLGQTLGFTADDKMRYEPDGGSTIFNGQQAYPVNCKPLLPVDNDGRFGLYMGRNSIDFDGAMALLKAKPVAAGYAATAGSLGGAAVLEPEPVPVRSRTGASADGGRNGSHAAAYFHQSCRATRTQKAALLAACARGSRREKQRLPRKGPEPGPDRNRLRGPRRLIIKIRN